MADEENKVEDQPELNFDSSLRKKKKKLKKLVESEEEAEEVKEYKEVKESTEVNEPTEVKESNEAKETVEAEEGKAAEKSGNAEEDLDAMFAEFKKKKKKKTKVAFVDEEGAVGKENEAPNDEEGGLSFGDGGTTLDEDSDIKKPRKKRNMAEFVAELGDDDGPGADGDLADEDDVFAADEGGDNVVQEEAWLKSDRDYTYQELLGRVFKVLRANNPELAGEKKRYTIVPPSVYRDSNKKTVFANVADICKRMHRQPEHVIQFLFAELGTSGSIDGAQRLIIKGRFQPKQIENVLRRYIVEYVTCKTCKSPDTILTKDNRLYFVQCESCGSTRSVSTIKTGFKAVGQGERKARARAAAA